MSKPIEQRTTTHLRIAGLMSCYWCTVWLERHGELCPDHAGKPDAPAKIEQALAIAAAGEDGNIREMILHVGEVMQAPATCPASEVAR